MRRTALIFALLGLASVPAHAQQHRLTAWAGQLTYDAGGDLGYTQFRLSYDRRVTPFLRLGVAASGSHIGAWTGDPGLLATPGAVGNETLYRANVTANVSTGFTQLAVLNRLRPWAEISAGVAHSAGRAKIEVPDSPFYAPVVDKPTGLALGAGVGMDVRLTHQFALRGGFLIWRDYLYGSSLDEEEFMGGAAVSF